MPRRVDRTPYTPPSPSSATSSARKKLLDQQDLQPRRLGPVLVTPTWGIFTTGDLVRIKGKHGLFRFSDHSRHVITGKEWVNVYDDQGRYHAFDTDIDMIDFDKETWSDGSRVRAEKVGKRSRLHREAEGDG